MNNLELLRMTKLFACLTDAELEALAENCLEENIPMGSVIVEENDAPRDNLFIIKEGEIAISTGHPESPEGVMLTTMGPGDIFGEMSLVDESPHSATVRAMSDATILNLSGAAFKKLVDANKNIGYIVMRNMAILVCERLRSANFTIKHFGFYGTPDGETDE